MDGLVLTEAGKIKVNVIVKFSRCFAALPKKCSDTYLRLEQLGLV